MKGGKNSLLQVLRIQSAIYHETEVGFNTLLLICGQIRNVGPQSAFYPYSVIPGTSRFNFGCQFLTKTGRNGLPGGLMWLLW